MKKFLYMSALVLMLSLGACAPSEVDDIFDDSPAVRLDNAISSYSEFFQKDGGKWLMQYFASGDEEGHCFIMTFKGDGSVEISTKNDYVNDGAFAQDVSLWEIVADYGPVLSFNTYNNVFHEFSSPQDDGTGHGGDYEFRIIKAEDNQAVLRGKKTNIEIIMTHLDASTDDALYFSQLDEAWSKFNENLPYIIMTTGGGLKYICQLHYYMYWYFYPETGNEIDNLEHMNAVITADGLRFMEPLDFLSEYEPDQVPVQNFELQADGTYLCVEDGVTRISAPSLAYVFMQFNTTRNLPTEEMTGEFPVIFNNLVDEAKTNTALRKPTIRGFSITYYNTVTTGDTERYMYNLHYDSSRNPGNIRVYIDKIDDNTVRISFDENDANAFDNNGRAFYNQLAYMREFVAKICGEYTLSAGNLLYPSPMVITSKSNPSNTLTVTL